MNNVFYSQKDSFTFRDQSLRKVVSSEANKQAIDAIINNFFEKQQHITVIQYANLVRDVLGKCSNKDVIEKLLHTFVYFATIIETAEIIKIFESIKNLGLSPLLLVKFYSFVFKSVHESSLKKWLIFSSLQAMQKEQKTTPFISFIENFQLIVGTLNLESQQLIEVYWKLIIYLEKHLIYKKLSAHYVFVALNLVTQAISSNQTVTKLLVKAIYSDNFDENTTDILNKQPLKAHQLYPILEARITGDITALAKVTVWEKHAALDKQKITRKVRIEAIPRLFKHIKQASYAQAAQMLGIQKKQVQGYIIEAVRLGIMKAKLDEYQQTILINKLNLRCLQKGEQVQLQKEISDLCESLDKVTA